MRKIFKNLAILSLALLLASCGSKDSSKKAEDDTLKLGVVGERNVEYEDAIKRYEEDTGKHIELVRFSDYNQPNDALKDGDIDLSSFATYIFIEDYNKNQNAGFTYLADSIISPMGVYSSKLKNVDELEEGSKVAIPVETSNNSRALYILEAAGVIKIKKDAGDFITVDDIEENPKKGTLRKVAVKKQPATKKSRSFVRTGVKSVGIVLVVLILAGIAYFFLSKKSKK